MRRRPHAPFSLCCGCLWGVWWGLHGLGLTLGVGVGRLFTCRRELVCGFVVVVHRCGGWVSWLGCLGCVGVVCELDSVFVCFYACFLFLSVFGWDCWPGGFVWLVFLGFNVFVFVRRV